MHTKPLIEVPSIQAEFSSQLVIQRTLPVRSLRTVPDLGGYSEQRCDDLVNREALGHRMTQAVEQHEFDRASGAFLVETKRAGKVVAVPSGRHRSRQAGAFDQALETRRFAGRE